MSDGARALWELAGKSPAETSRTLGRYVTQDNRAGVSAVIAYVQGKLDNKQGMSGELVSQWKAVSTEAAHAWHRPATTKLFRSTDGERWLPSGKTTVNSKTRAALIKKIDSEIEKKVASEMATRKPAKKRGAKKRAKKRTKKSAHHVHALREYRDEGTPKQLRAFMKRASKPTKRASKKRKSHKGEKTVTLEGLRKGQYKTWTCKGRVRSGCGGGGRVVH